MARLSVHPGIRNKHKVLSRIVAVESKFEADGMVQPTTAGIEGEGGGGGGLAYVHMDESCVAHWPGPVP